jgi:hypothetical protein
MRPPLQRIANDMRADQAIAGGDALVAARYFRSRV